MKLGTQDLECMNRVLRHRLRNLAAGIRTSTSLLSQELKDRLTPAETEYFPLIIDVCDRINEITDRFNLLFSDLPGGGECDVAAAIGAAVAALRRQIPTAQVRVDVDETTLGTRIVSDQLVGIALREALTNAAEASFGREIVLDGGSDEEKLYLEVRDQGEGLSPEKEALLFCPFHAPRERHLGLGLAAARRALEQIGGEITATRNTPTGLCVRLVLPRTPETAADRQPPVYGSFPKEDESAQELRENA